MLAEQTELRRAAVLVASLDEETAASLLSDLPEQHSAQIREIILQLNDLSFRERQAVIEAFLEQTRTAYEEPNNDPISETCEGIPLTEYTTRGNMGPFSRATVNTESPHVGRLNRIIDDVSSDVMRRVVKDEQPQTIAMVIAALTPVRGARFLDSFPTDQQSAIVQRLADVDHIDTEVVEEIAVELVKRLENELKRPVRTQGKQILAALRDVVRGEQCQRISKHLHQSLSEQESADSDWNLDRARDSVSKIGADFMHLIKMDGPTLDGVFRKTSLDCVAIAVAGLPTPTAEQLLGKLPSNTADLVRQQLADTGPLRLIEIQKAQESLVRAARQSLGASVFKVPKPSSRITFSA